MPVLDRVAKFQPLQPGCAKITLNRFNALQLLGSNYAQRIELLVVRRNEAPLADWHSPAPDGFLSIIPKNPRQHAMDFEFEVGPEVVNPMAFDNSGDYILRIRDVNGVIMSCSVAMQGAPRAGSVFHNGANLNPLNAQGKVQQSAASTPGMGDMDAGAGAGMQNPYMPPRQPGAPGAMGAQGMGTPNLDTVTSGGGNAIKIIAALVVVFVLLGGAAFLFRNEIAGLLGLGSDTLAEQSVEADAAAQGASDESQVAAPGSEDSTATNQAAAAAAALLGEDEESETAAGNGSAPTFESVSETVNVATAPDTSSSAAPAPSTSSAAPLTAAQACTLVNNSGNDQTVIARCLNAKPNTDQLNNLLREALQNNRCEIALKILSSKGRSANGGNYAYVYGLMADPNVRGGAKCIVKKTEDSEYWYEQAKKDPNFDRKEAIKLANFLVM